MSSTSYLQQYYDICSTSCITVPVPSQYTGLQNYLQQVTPRKAKVRVDGRKPVVVCNNVVTEAKDMEDAQRIAESEAHSKGMDAYILKPAKRIAPKREVVTTDL